MNTLRSFTETVVTTPTDTFPISFEYSEKYDAVHVFLNGVAVEDLGYVVSNINAVTLKIEPAITAGTVRIERETDIDKMLYIFDAGALFIDQNVDADFKQIVHSQQEVRDGFIKLRSEVLPLVTGLEEALETASEAAEAAQDAANTAQEAAQEVRSAVLSETDLSTTAVWEGKTVYLKDRGLFIYTSGSWISAALSGASYVYPTTTSFSAAMVDAFNRAMTLGNGKVVVVSGKYTVDATVVTTLTKPLTLEFQSGCEVNNTTGITAFNIDINGKFLKVEGNGAQFPCNWDTPIETSPCLMKLNDYTLNMSCNVSNLRSGDTGTKQYTVGVLGVGLNLSIFDSCLFRAGTGFQIESRDTSNTSTHSMGNQFRDNVVYSTVAYRFVNNGALSTEGWTITGGEVISDTAFIVQRGTFTGYSIVGRISDIHVNAIRFGSFEGLNRLYVSQTDYQMNVVAGSTYTACIELKGCQSVQLGLGISRVFGAGASVNDQLSVLGLMTPNAGQSNAFINLTMHNTWLATASKPMVNVQSASAAAAIVITTNGAGAYPNRLITQGYEDRLNVAPNYPVDTTFVNNGYCSSSAVTFDAGTGVLTLTGKPVLGTVYDVGLGVVPSGSNIKSINSSPMMGKDFTLVFSAQNLVFTHSASLLTPAAQPYYVDSTCVVRVKSINYLTHRILDVSGAVQDRVVSKTTAQLQSATDAINTSVKYLGREVWNSTLSKFMKATGSSPTSTWVSTDGGTTLTPS
ncbi:tailspike protein [Acinetobacter phage vB_Api_3043-K38]|uniref:Tailspike protein n=1 Tax=Acinetobacter phage vB_Api_3043-K38 TaxID=2862717 RepID=A0AC61NDC9_9CAUD|nr:tailspike protein [Acinetobacter phage vB_Api_3043-K38]